VVICGTIKTITITKTATIAMDIIAGYIKAPLTFDLKSLCFSMVSASLTNISSNLPEASPA